MLNEEVPLLSPCAAAAAAPAPAMLSKNVGGKFKYLNRKNSEFLAGNLNAKCKRKKKKCTMQMPMHFYPNLNFLPNPKLSLKPVFTKPKIFART